jgi:hypothetical protein
MHSHFRYALANRLGVTKVSLLSTCQPSQYPRLGFRVTEGRKPRIENVRLNKSEHLWIFYMATNGHESIRSDTKNKKILNRNITLCFSLSLFPQSHASAFAIRINENHAGGF